MSIMSAVQQLFGGAGANPQPMANPNIPPNPNNPMQTMQPGVGLPGTVQNVNTAANGVIPAPTLPDPNAAPQSPMDAFKDIWQTPETPPGSEPKSMFANMDPKKVLESARRQEFAKTLPPELIAKIQAGGADGMVALMAAMDHTSQNVYAQSAMATAKIVEQALAKQASDFQSQLPSLVRKLSANESLRTDNPILNNPAVQPLVGALTEQFQRKNPNASSQEIQQQVNGYFDMLGNVFAPKPVLTPEAKRAADGATDWDKFLNA